MKTFYYKLIVLLFLIILSSTLFGQKTHKLYFRNLIIFKTKLKPNYNIGIYTSQDTFKHKYTTINSFDSCGLNVKTASDFEFKHVSYNEYLNGNSFKTWSFYKFTSNDRKDSVILIKPLKYNYNTVNYNTIKSIDYKISKKQSEGGIGFIICPIVMIASPFIARDDKGQFHYDIFIPTFLISGGLTVSIFNYYRRRSLSNYNISKHKFIYK